ncbi:MAG: phosphoglycerol geranylgeranyltransferase [Bernardetiaceae bacterium]
MLQSLLQPAPPRLVWLIDPDGKKNTTLHLLPQLPPEQHPDCFLVGGSLLWEDRLEETLDFLRTHSTRPRVIFPGNAFQISGKADALLFLSLISGRNPEWLIGQHVLAAPRIGQAGLPTIPTGYLLVDGGRNTAVHYLTQTQAIPRDKPELAAATALAGQFLGQQLIYLEAGSGASLPVPPEMIRRVSETVRIPVWVGGGIATPELAQEAWASGASAVVVGSALEKNPEAFHNFWLAKQSCLP